MTEQQTNPIEENKIGEIRKCLRKSDLENILGVKEPRASALRAFPDFQNLSKSAEPLKYGIGRSLSMAWNTKSRTRRQLGASMQDLYNATAALHLSISELIEAIRTDPVLSNAEKLDALKFWNPAYPRLK